MTALLFQIGAGEVGGGLGCGVGGSETSDTPGVHLGQKKIKKR